MRRLLRSLPLLAVAAMMPLPAFAQTPAMRVDTLVRIVAIVGDSVITNGELRRSVELWASQEQQPIPPAGEEPDSLIQQLLNDRIDALLLVQAALSDTSIVVTDDEVRTGVDAQIASVRANYPTLAAFEQALAAGNLTLQEYRSMLGAQLRQQRLIDAYMGKELRARNAPPISDQAVRDYFNAQLGAGGTPPTLPPSVTFAQIVIPVLPSDTALARAKAKADSLLQLIRVEGQDFATLARRFSEDPGSAELGGDLGWFRPGGMTLNFELAAYSPLLRPGDVSDPVLTQYGYHLIKLERIRGPERQARHILIRPATYDEDRDRAHKLADSVAAMVRSGASLDSLRRVHGDRDEPERLGPVVRDSMPAEYVAAMAGAKDGDIIGPFVYTGTVPKWVILRVERMEEERTATVADYRERIQEQLGRERLFQEILSELKRQTYIEIRPRATNPRN